MKLGIKTYAIVTAALVAAVALSATGTRHFDGFAPDNTEWIPAGARLMGTEMTKAQFDGILDRVSAFYAPIIQAKRKTFVINRKWDDGTVNAYAHQDGNKWVIEMFGGLARHPAITSDGFMLVACHETGHHLGGAPKVQDWMGASWASNEGQSDFFGNLQCMKNLLKNDDNISIVKTMDVDAEASTQCHASYTDAKEAALCERIAMAGFSLAQVLSQLHKDKVAPAFATPDTSVVSQTNDEHPEAQCRLDTYFHGALCNAASTARLDDSNPNTGTCENGGNEMTARPRCWFKPSAGWRFQRSMTGILDTRIYQ